MKAVDVLRTFVNKHGLRQILADLLQFVYIPCFGDCCCVLIFFFNEKVGSMLAVCIPAMCHRHVWDQVAFLLLGVRSRISSLRLTIEKTGLGLTKELLISGSRNSKKGTARGNKPHCKDLITPFQEISSCLSETNMGIWVI